MSNFSSTFSFSPVRVVSGLMIAWFASLLLSGCGDQDKVYNVAIYAETFIIADRVDGLRDGLKSLGYTEGKNINYIMVDTSSLTPTSDRSLLRKPLTRTMMCTGLSIPTLRSASNKW